MELDIRTRGRAAEVIDLEVVREITQDDLHLLQLPRDSKPNRITKLRDRHHALARLLAQGYTERDAAIITGYELSSVSILKGDPTFAELVSFYRDKVEEKFDGFNAKLSTIANDAASLLIEKLEDEEEAAKLTPGQLMALVELGADRTGYGKQTRNESLNVNVGLAASLEEARKRVKERKQLKLVEDLDARPTE